MCNLWCCQGQGCNSGCNTQRLGEVLTYLLLPAACRHCCCEMPLSLLNMLLLRSLLQLQYSFSAIAV
jgi:hypothetical protein